MHKICWILSWTFVSTGACFASWSHFLKPQLYLHSSVPIDFHHPCHDQPLWPKPRFTVCLTKRCMSKIHQAETDSRRGRKYSSFELSNGIQVVVVSDPDKSVPAAAALAVLAGSIHEPKDRPGLAHFCEHMLLHGTIQPCYGDANFAEYLKQSGGKHNAVTTVLQTCYAFEVQSGKLEGALSRFARFFVSPIFSRSCQHQELQAIDAEHSMNTTNDFRRQWAILLTDVNPRHPYHWTSGCSRSLQNPNLPDLHHALESFHSSNYRSERMSLAVMGSQTIEELASWVRKYFSCVPSSRRRGVDLNHLMGDSLGGDEPPFLAEDFCGQAPLKNMILLWAVNVSARFCFFSLLFMLVSGGQILVVPVKEVHQLKLSWILPWQVTRWRSKPTAYVKYLLEQEGDGSLRAALADAGLSHHQSISVFDYHGVASTLEVSLDLVDTKEMTVLEAGSLAFAYISMIRSQQIQRRILEEIQQLQELSFHYPDISNSAPFNFVQDLACNLHYYPAEEVLAADHLIYTLDVEGSQSVLQHLTVQHLRLSLISKDFDSYCTSTEPWYGGRYLKFDSINSDWKAKWAGVEAGEWKQIAEKHRYQLPKRNTYLPSDLAMRAVAREDVPMEMEIQERNCRVWFKQSKVDQPKAAAAFCLYSSEISSPKQVALAHLYCKLLQQELKAEAFQLKVAGATYHLEIGSEVSGLLLQVFGFRDTLPMLARKVSETMTSRHRPSRSGWKHLKDQQAAPAGIKGKMDRKALCFFESKNCLGCFRKNLPYFDICMPCIYLKIWSEWASGARLQKCQSRTSLQSGRGSSECGVQLTLFAWVWVFYLYECVRCLFCFHLSQHSACSALCFAFWSSIYSSEMPMLPQLRNRSLKPGKEDPMTAPKSTKEPSFRPPRDSSGLCSHKCCGR